MILKRELNIFMYIGLLYLAVHIGACTYDQQGMLPEFPDYPEEYHCDEDIGPYNLLPSSITYTPYIGIDSVMYLDSQGTVMVFSVKEGTIYTSKGALMKYNVFELGDTVVYCYQTEAKHFSLVNLEEDMKFSLSIAARPEYTDPASRHVRDEFSIWYVHPDPPPFISTQVFFATIDLRTASYPYHNIVIPQLEVFGKKFFDVERTNYNNPKIALWFNRTEGIVSFIDPNGKKWRWSGFK